MTRTRSALVVRGGWEGHSPVEATELFIPHLREEGFEVRVEESPVVYADEAVMRDTDLVVQCMTMTTIEKAELEGLRAAVAAGTGFAGWHGGIADSYRNSSDYLHLVGGQFACHPPKAPEERKGDASDNFLRYTVEMLPEAQDHPVTKGLADFELTTEQYWVLADSYCDVLATTTLAARPWDPWHRPVVSPAIWTRQWGEGKIFVATPGHDLETLRDPNVTTIVERGLLWASR
ncbi:hypothetical protein EV189_3015 [Motilibacter rhizosphaerae]|uniref:ThuA-like domain-containing protein n=1 Tax=Motilibacter rhizosphaerae TaxID=598652 RepID=A0A4Q7NQS2_9ACTN|nr:ThuA domain-containing protein [Motilibacter rhizosphaerae]RZS87583.1 hypothetical protein EV189_3015 [Motilibacter rhizosphaerae]